MKVAISATDSNLEARVDPAFGRCQYFIIYDTDINTHKIIPNPGSGMTGSAGSTAAQTVMEQEVTEILTGKVGLKSRPILERAGITIRENQTGTIADILSNLKVTPQPKKAILRQGTASAKESRQSDRNPVGYCFCHACGYQCTGDPGVPCFKQRCPQCNCGLERQY
jgi:predicted Fe-Mo cluster-binding NifX family protein